MNDIVTITETKINLTAIINRIVSKKERFTITRKGKKVAHIIPLEDPEPRKKNGLLYAKGALGDIDDSVDEMVGMIYKARDEEKSREVLI